MINLLKKSLIIFAAIYLYLISFGGVLTKFTINNSLLFNIKQITPDIILVLIIVLGSFALLYENTVYKFKWHILIILYFSVCIVLSYLNVKNGYLETIYTIRDVYLPFLILFIMMELNLYNTYYIKINKILINYAYITTILGFILALIEYISGFEWTSKFYTGYIFYGMDIKANIMINYTLNGKLRVPSIAGSSVLFGFYSLIAFLIILNKCKKGLLKKFFLIISISNIVFSTNKTCIFLVILILILYIFRRIKGSKKIFTLIIISIGALLIFIYLLSNTNIFYSIKDRISLTWIQVFNDIDILSLFIPYNSFNIGSSIRDITNVKSYVDNSYIYILIIYGIIGVFVYIYTILEVMFTANRNKVFIKELTLIAFISGITISIFQARSYFTPYCLLVGLMYSFNNTIKEGKNDINNI